MPATLSETDRLIDEFVAFRNQLTTTFRDKHPYLFAAATTVLAGKESKFGMRITEGGRPVGEYTLSLSGTTITGAVGGRLESGIQLPYIGVLKPFISIERDRLESILADRDAILADPFQAMLKHLPSMTIGFLP